MLLCVVCSERLAPWQADDRLVCQPEGCMCGEGCARLLHGALTAVDGGGCGACRHGALTPHWRKGRRHRQCTLAPCLQLDRDTRLGHQPRPLHLHTRGARSPVDQETFQADAKSADLRSAAPVASLCKCLVRNLPDIAGNWCCNCLLVMRVCTLKEQPCRLAPQARERTEWREVLG